MELTCFFQAGQMTQIGALEHLKLENVTLSHQLTQTQHRSIKEKERIAVQLQSIEVCPLFLNYKITTGCVIGVYIVLWFVE